MSRTIHKLLAFAAAIAMAFALGATSTAQDGAGAVLAPLEHAPGLATGRAARDTDRAPRSSSLAWVRQKSSADVSGLRLTLADVAEVDALDPTTAAHLRTLDLGEIPSKGRRIVLSRETLREAVSQEKLGDQIQWEGATSTQVDLRLFSLSADEVESLGRRHVAKALGRSGAEATFGAATPPKSLSCVAGRWSTRVFVRTQPNERFSGPVRLEVVAVADGIERIAVPFVVEVERKGRVLVAARDLAAGSAIKNEDLKSVERNLAAVGPDSVELAERVVGMVLARRVPAGQVLTTRDLRLPSVIERDDVIQIRYVAGGLKVTGLGKAQAPGAPGERIPVMNLASNKIVHAIVVDSRTVEIRSGFNDS